MAAVPNILTYNNALNQYNAGNYSQAQQTAAPYGSSVSSQFAAPSAGGGSSKPASSPAPASSTAPQSTSNLPNLDALYAPIFQAYSNEENQVNSANTAEQGQLTNQFNTSIGELPGEQASAQNTINQEQVANNNIAQSAYGQAAQNFNLAQGSAQNQFGDSGAALAGNWMAAQELGRENSQVTQQQLQGNMQVGGENTDLVNWVNTTTQNINNQYQQAQVAVNQYFQGELMNIENDVNQTQVDKTNNKMDLLSSAIQANNQISLQYQGLQQQLQLLQTTGGTGMDTTAFQTQMTNIQNQINSNVNPANQEYNVALGGNSNIFGNQYTSPSQGTNNDLINQVVGGTNTAATVPNGADTVGGVNYG